MSKYLSLFEQDSEYRESSKTLPNVSNVIEDEAVYYQDDYSGEYLTFKILSDGIINWKCQSEATSKTIEYSINGGEWTSITATTTGVSFPITSGNIVRFRGNNTVYAALGTRGSNFNGTTVDYSIYGNIDSLVTDDFENYNSRAGYAFRALFWGTNVIDAKNLYLGKVVSNAGFYELFRGCTKLKTPPILPNVTQVYMDSYAFMFYGCTSLQYAPNLVATIIGKQSYNNMFYGCTSLTKTPKLPATTLGNNCYYQMFYGCNNLINIPELPATTLSDYCYYQMFAYCTKLNGALTLPAINLKNSCYRAMFQNCTNLSITPKILATTLETMCCTYMFLNCKSLTRAPELYSNTLVNACYQQMFQNCSSLNHITCLATDISATDCTKNWVSGVAATGTFVKAAGMENWNIDDVNGIPHGWETKSKVITQEYITANGQIETDFQLTSDNYKIVSSYYIPSIDASWKTMYYFNNGVYHQLLKNNNKLGLYFIRYNANAPRIRLVEQVTSINDAPSSTGTNVVTYVEHPSNIGSGVYCDYTSSLSSAENNYPYDTWDQYLETKPSVKLTNNYTTGSSDVEIQNLKLLSSAPTGTRFYGIKVWSGNDNQVVFDGVPAKYGTEDAIYDKVSGHIYTTSQIITT